MEEIGEDVGPESGLEIRVDQVSAVEWAAEGGGGEIFRRGEELVGE